MPTVSIVIPTYKRANFLGYVLEALENQKYKDFEVVIVLKPAEDGSEKIIEKHSQALNIVLILQKCGGYIEALTLGIEHSRGKIIAFLDDDAVPFANWIEKHVETYKKFNVGGVVGDVVSAVLVKDRVIPINEFSSEIIPRTSKREINRKPWHSPLKGLEDYGTYITKSGHIYNRLLLTKSSLCKTVSGMGANMSFSRNALETFHFPNDWMAPYAYESFLGWHLWKNKQLMIFNPDARVLHITHASSLGRSRPKRNALLYAEYELFFYRLYNYEKGLSLLCKLLSIVATTLSSPELSLIGGLFYGNLYGLKWLVYNKIGRFYNPLRELYSSFGKKI